MHRDFNLSGNTSLRRLETTAESITAAGEAAPGFLNTVLSTITSPLPIDVVINYGEREGDYYVFSWEKHVFGLRHTDTDRMATDAQHRVGRFQIFREMQGVQGFRLVLCTNVHDCIAECARWALEHAVETELEGGGSGYLLQGPLIITEMRSVRSRCTDDAVGIQTKWPIRASAL